MVLPDLCTIDETAAYFRLTRRGIEEWVAKRRIKSIRVQGGHVRIPASELQRIVTEGTRPVFKR
jgi:excisionase family DNA binding protein